MAGKPLPLLPPSWDALSMKEAQEAFSSGRPLAARPGILRALDAAGARWRTSPFESNTRAVPCCSCQARTINCGPRRGSRRSPNSDLTAAKFPLPVRASSVSGRGALRLPAAESASHDGNGASRTHPDVVRLRRDPARQRRRLDRSVAAHRRVPAQAPERLRRGGVPRYLPPTDLADVPNTQPCNFAGASWSGPTAPPSAGVTTSMPRAD